MKDHSGEPSSVTPIWQRSSSYTQKPLFISASQIPLLLTGRAKSRDALGRQTPNVTERPLTGYWPHEHILWLRQSLSFNSGCDGVFSRAWCGVIFSPPPPPFHVLQKLTWRSKDVAKCTVRGRNSVSIYLHHVVCVSTLRSGENTLATAWRSSVVELTLSSSISGRLPIGAAV